MTTKQQIEEATASLTNAIEKDKGSTKDKKILRRLQTIVGISTDALHTARSAQSRVTNVAKAVEAVQGEVASMRTQLDETMDATSDHQSEIDSLKQAVSDLALNQGEIRTAVIEMREQMQSVMKEFVTFTEETRKTLEALANA